MTNSTDILRLASIIADAFIDLDDLDPTDYPDSTLDAYITDASLDLLALFDDTDNLDFDLALAESIISNDRPALLDALRAHLDPDFDNFNE